MPMSKPQAKAFVKVLVEKTKREGYATLPKWFAKAQGMDFLKLLKQAIVDNGFKTEHIDKEVRIYAISTE